MNVEFEDRLIAMAGAVPVTHGILDGVHSPTCNRLWSDRVLLPALLSAASFQVHDYGAKGDGCTSRYPAIQKAIDAAAKTGAPLIFKPGVYLTGSIFLKSGTHLRDR